MFQKLIRTSATPWVLLIRIMVGAVFLSEGIQKFLFPEQVGSGRFARIGIPSPEFMAPFVGVFEILCGALVLLGLLTRFACVPLIVIMIVALASTKWPMLQADGFWTAAHASRNDWAMFWGSIFLLIVGGGRWSLDHALTGRGQ